MSSRIGLYGLGSIGLAIASEVARRNLDIGFAVDVDPAKVGKELGVIGGPRGTGTIVSGAQGFGDAGSCDVVLHSTCSRVKDAFPQIESIANAGCNVISTCEELSFPYLRQPALSEKMDALALDSGVTILGTGVNPGFLLDALPAFMTRVCRRVDAITATRNVEAAVRREPLQRKIGLGMDPGTFKDRTEKGTMGHVGLLESCALVADSMGWELAEVRQHISPVVADRDMETEHFKISPGQVRGLRQTASGVCGGETRIRLLLEMSVHPENPGDFVEIDGEPPVSLAINNGVNGDVATVGRMVGCIDEVVAAPPGLATVLSLPVKHPIPGRTTRVSPKLTGNARLI
jgi:4-hydroxy-tetrahydrodipicolinate reductase